MYFFAKVSYCMDSNEPLKVIRINAKMSSITQIIRSIVTYVLSSVSFPLVQCVWRIAQYVVIIVFLLFLFLWKRNMEICI